MATDEGDKMPELTMLARRLPRSGIRAIMDLAATVGDVIHLEVGDPDFATPEHIVRAASEAAAAGLTHYSPNAGLACLRERIAEKLERSNRLHVGPEQIVVTPGSGEALFSTVLALVEPGDEVLLPDPAWPNFTQMVLAAHARPVSYPLDRRTGFLPDLDALESLATPRTRVLLVNSPGNPTGAVLPRATVRRLADFAERHDLFVVSDECYERIVFEGEHVSVAEYAGFERTVVVQSFSKTYAMTGWRVGYAAASPELAEVLAKLQEPIVSCASTVSQKAAEAALTGPQQPVEAMCAAYRRRRDRAVDIVGAAGLLPAVPHGAFYMLVDVSAAGVDTYAFARQLVVRDRVAVSPGEAFGPGGAGLVRISLASDDHLLEEGLRRLVAAVRRGAA
jgi:aspartate/methionine/tyrosine aminotransferase